MKGERKLALGLAALGLVLAIIAWRGMDTRGEDALVASADTSGRETVSIVWAGDTMVGDASVAVAVQHGYEWPFAGVRHLLDGDVVVVNAEGPLTTLNQPFSPSKNYSYTADPASAPALASAGVTVLGLANNHTLDQGPAGLADTISCARQAGLTAFGAGMNDGEAERPLLVRGSGVTIGIVALAKGYGTRVTAGRARAGTVALSAASIKRGYALARGAGADVVVAFVHWGENYRDLMPEQEGAAADFAAAGYALVVGHGPHVMQRAEMVGSMPVFYSLGNFVFGTPGRWTDDHRGTGLVLKTELGSEGVTSMTVTCIDVDNRRVAYQPCPSNPSDAAAAFRILGLPAVVNGATATLETPRGG